MMLASLLAELEAFGRANDAANAERERRMLNITRETGEFLAVLAKAGRAKRVLELGTSNGYSTLWLAAAVSALCGTVTTVEISELKAQMAAENFARSGLAGCITLRRQDAASALAGAADASFDFVFLDCERRAYAGWWPELKRVLAPGGLLVADNAVSHAHELEAFRACVQADGEFTACLVPVGNGEFVAVRARAWA
jgi:predicted O-methyltransferase YrrM